MGLPHSWSSSPAAPALGRNAFHWDERCKSEPPTASNLDAIPGSAMWPSAWLQEPARAHWGGRAGLQTYFARKGLIAAEFTLHGTGSTSSLSG